MNRPAPAQGGGRGGSAQAPGEPAVGKRLYWGGTDGTPKTVVGVVGDYEDAALESDPSPVLFLPNNQIGWPSMTLMVRSSGDVSALAAAIREHIHSIDPLLPVPTGRKIPEDPAVGPLVGQVPPPAAHVVDGRGAGGHVGQLYVAEPGTRAAVG